MGGTGGLWFRVVGGGTSLVEADVERGRDARVVVTRHERRLREEHRPVDRDRPAGPVDAASDVAEERPLHVAQEAGLVLHAVDLLVTDGARRGPARGRAVRQEHGQAALRHPALPQHHRVRAVLQPRQGGVVELAPELDEPLGVEPRPLGLTQGLDHGGRGWRNGWNRPGTYVFVYTL